MENQLAAARWQSKHTTHNTHIYFILSFSLSLSLVRPPCLSVCLPTCQYVRFWMNIKQIINVKCQKKNTKNYPWTEFCYFIRSASCLLVIFLLFSVHYFFVQFNKQFNVLNNRKGFHSKYTANFSHPTAVCHCHS